MQKDQKGCVFFTPMLPQVEKFTEECVKYLNKKYGKYGRFEVQRKSKVPGIIAIGKSQSYIIRPMLPGMQCAKFNVSVDCSDKVFCITNAGNNQNYKVSEILDRNYDLLKSGEHINLLDAQSVFFNWLVIEYESINVKYVITKTYEVIPIKQLRKCANIICRYNQRKGTIVFYLQIVPNTKGLSIQDFLYSLI